MRITRIELYSDRFEENLQFALQKTSPFEKYMIRQIVGLDAEELIPRFYGFGKRPATLNNPRKKFFDFYMKPREVAMRVALNPNFKNNETYSDVRDELYKMISATRTGELILYFYSGTTVVAQLTGFVTKFEGSYFTALPEVQITLQCDDPMLTGVAPVVWDLDDSEYSNPIVVDSFLQVPDTLSTAPHGFRFNGVYTDDQSGHPSFRMRDAATLGEAEWEFIIAYVFDVGDQLYFSSVSGDKYLYVVKASDDSVVHLLDQISSVSTWPIVFPGQNGFYCTQLDPSDGDDILEIHHVEYFPTYWGV